jgi:hypothetical protein
LRVATAAAVAAAVAVAAAAAVVAAMALRQHGGRRSRRRRFYQLSYLYNTICTSELLHHVFSLDFFNGETRKRRRAFLRRDVSPLNLVQVELVSEKQGR